MKKMLVIAAMCLFLLSGCSWTALGFALTSCGATCAACSADEYPFIHDVESFDDVKIEIVLLEDKYEGEDDTGQAVYSDVIVPVSEITDKDAFMNDFERLWFTYPFGSPIFSIQSSKAICFTYPDGQVEIVSPWGSGLFTDSTLKEEIRIIGMTSDRHEFAALWEKWSQEN